MLVSVAKIETEVQSLASCSYDAETFTKVLASIQKAVDEMNLYSYTNLASWVSSLDKSVSEPKEKYRRANQCYFVQYNLFAFQEM